MSNTLLHLKDIFPLFDTAQKAEIFNDQKTMADAIPKYPISQIMKRFHEKFDMDAEELKEFVSENFITKTKFEENNNSNKTNCSIIDHIEKLWKDLTRDTSEDKGTLIKLPKPYIVPGGRFMEFFYWDSYFIMLGLQVSKNTEMMKNIVDNCAYLIQKYGFIPNANRTYFLSRSQPPYFSLMIELLFETTGDILIYSNYYETLRREYEFWMEGNEKLENNAAYKHIIKTKEGEVLNRYYDLENTPRPESYLIDIEDSKNSKIQEYYQNIRAACESGWDFSSRWFKDQKSIKTICTLDIAPVDLNCLLWHLENTLSKTASLLGYNDDSLKYKNKSIQRMKIIEKYFWEEETGMYKDYLFQTRKHSLSQNLATLYPLFLKITDKRKAQKVAENIREKFLHKGGLITTTINSGEQWDSPNAWAPYQWIGYKAMNNYKFDVIAHAIKTNWCTNVERVFQNTNKLMEKYDAIDTNNLAGGGEYPNQDGFGWTNGVYMRLKHL